MRTHLLLPLLGVSLALGGCVASLAAGAIGAAARGSQQGGDRYYNDEAVKLAAAQACRGQAEQHGQVQVIDVEQRSPTKVMVWGTATADARRRSFECRFDRRITSFRLRNLD